MSSSAFSLNASSAGRKACRTLHIVFGDQLTDRVCAFADFDDDRDVILLAEVDAESGVLDDPAVPPSHKVRTAAFLSAMRHFAAEQARKGRRVRYISLDARGNTHAFQSEIERAVDALKPERLRATRPGEWRVLRLLEQLGADRDIPLDIHEDDHFLVTPDQFNDWASGRKSLTMEYFYREQRKRLGILMDGKQPAGGDWNYDKENRETFKYAPTTPDPLTNEPDAVTREVIDLVNRRYPDNPGNLDPQNFRWPVTRAAALSHLDEFIKRRLADFGPYEDAMWTNEPFLFHSLLSVPLNLKLIDPMECVERAVDAYESGAAPLNSVEGFVRQLIGWREFIRGVYWHEGPDYRDRNALDEHGDLPEFFWTAETDMRCLADSLKPVLDHAYSHHIPRLMVISAFCMMAGVHPRQVGDWFYTMYADSVDWVTTPNTIGMALHADHGVVGTKPYAASGKYISRMSNYCKNCRYDVNARTGDDACPYNVFFWDFLMRHNDRFASNNRMAMMLKNVQRIKRDERVEITVSARKLRGRFGISAPS